MRDYYKVDECNGVYWVKLSTLEKLPFNSPKSSYNVLKARVFNLYYDEYLFYVKENFNATLKGINSKYITEFFKEKKDADYFCKVINNRFNKILDNCHL